jgi:hypothetical protein
LMMDLLTLLTIHPSGHHYFHLDSHPLHLRLRVNRYRGDARRLSWKERKKRETFCTWNIARYQKRLMTMVISSSSIESIRSSSVVRNRRREERLCVDSHFFMHPIYWDSVSHFSFIFYRCQ